jgi:hypothetical protein
VDCEVAFWGGNLRSIDFNVTALISLVPAIGGRMRARGHGGIPIDPHADSPESVAAKTLDDVARGRTNSYPGKASRRLTTTLASSVLPRSTVARRVAITCGPEPVRTALRSSS